MSHILTDVLMGRVTREARTGEGTGGSRYPRHHEVAQRAYALYEARGRVDGHDFEDWLLAERELVQHDAYSASGDSSPADDLAAIAALRHASTLRS